MNDNNKNRKPKKIINYDDIPVGGGMGGGGDFSVEIKVAPKKNNYIQNNSFNDNNNIQFRNENSLRQNLDNRTDFKKTKRNNNCLDEKNNNNINNNNFEPDIILIVWEVCSVDVLH